MKWIPITLTSISECFPALISKHHLRNIRVSLNELLGIDIQERPEEITNYKQNIKAISLKLACQKNFWSAKWKFWTEAWQIFYRNNQIP